jgi:Mg-chelatase subunit ChlD
MKLCPSCGASNSDKAKFCGECGIVLVSLPDDSKSIDPISPSPTIKMEVPRSKTTKKLEIDKLTASLSKHSEMLHRKKQADIMFVVDCTGSMQGELNAIQDAIADFADTIEKEGVRVRVGLIEFRDRLINEEHRALRFNGEVFTSDPNIFREKVSQLRAMGGGDEPESSLDAIMFALRQPFNLEGNKVIVLVTDAPPHIPDKDTKSIDEVVNAIARLQIHQVYLICPTQNPRNQIYLKLLEKTRGMAFELGQGDDFRQRSQDFQKTLMALGKTISSATK